MASYQDLLQKFIAIAPQDVLALQGRPEFGDAFNRWAGEIAKDLGVGSFEEIPIEVVDQYEIVPAQGATTGPAEQQLFNAIAPGITANIAGDAGRTADVANLTGANNAAFGNLASVIGQQAATFDGAGYVQRNPGVGQLFASLNDGATPGTKSVPTPQGVQDMDLATFGTFHYQNFGKNEGLQPVYTSEVLNNQNRVVGETAAAQTSAAQTAAKSTLEALATNIASQTQNLQGALGQQAAALATAIGQFSQNIDQLDASQKQALAAQLAQMQQNLEQSIGAQRAALQQQVTELQGNATAAAQQRRAALEQEIAALTAAQAPVAEARTRGAEAVATSINLGAQSALDQIKADAAREGFVGPSSFTEAAQTRALVGARQDAARGVADAATLNAGDLRRVQELGATGRMSIEDALAQQLQGAGNLGASGRFDLSSALAKGTQGVGDFGATGQRTISDATANNRFGLGNYGASTTYDNTNKGIGANLSLANALSQGTYDVSTNLAGQTQNIANNAAAARAGYSDQLFPNSLNAAQLMTQIPGQNAAANAALIPYGSAGARDALNLLSWFSTPNNPPSTTAIQTNPSTQGNAYGNLGANLFGAAFKYAPFNWNPPKTGVTTGATANASNPAD